MAGLAEELVKPRRLWFPLAWIFWVWWMCPAILDLRNYEKYESSPKNLRKKFRL